MKRTQGATSHSPLEFFALEELGNKRIVGCVMTYSPATRCYSATSLSDFKGWQIISSLPTQGKGRMYRVAIARGKQRRAVYVSKSIGITLQNRAREDALRFLLHRPEPLEPPQPESY